MTSPNFSIISQIFRPAQTFEYSDVGPNRWKYRILMCFIYCTATQVSDEKVSRFQKAFQKV